MKLRRWFTGEMLTFGHGRLDSAALAHLVTGADLELVVDVRRFPGSRANPDSARGRIPATLAAAGLDYRWDERLGGRRSLPAAERESSPDRWWRVEAFRAYAAWTRSEHFRSAVPDLVADDARQRTAIMCSEAVWWRCHRRLISDVLLLECHVPVHHLMHDGRLVEHLPSEGARLDDDGHVIWDAAPRE